MIGMGGTPRDATAPRLVIRALSLAEASRHEHDAVRRQEYTARKRAIEAALHRLDALSRQHRLAPAFVEGIRAHHQDRLRHVRHSIDGNHTYRKSSAMHDDEIELALIEAERSEINELFRQGELNDEARRQIERDLDLRQVQLLGARLDE
jgi:CPA1 family monovalent cation:H+ antiporter